MKRVAYVTVYWGDEFGKPPKTLAEKARDERLAQEILQTIKNSRNIKITETSIDHYHLEITGDEGFRFLMEVLQPASHLVTHTSVRVWKTYSRQELEAASLLEWRITNQAIEDDYYDFDYYDPSNTSRERDTEGVGPSFKECSACRTSLEQVRDLVVNKRLMRGNDISLTYSYQVIMAEWVGRLLQEHGLTGFDLRPVHHYKKPYKGEPTLYQLVVTNALPPMASPPTKFEQFHHCDVCGRTSRFLKHTHWWGKIQYYEETDVYYPRSVLEVVQDFNHTVELFGERVASPYIIITQRVYRLLREHKVKNWEAVPVYLVD